MLTIAVSSRALFHMDESHAIFERDGQAKFDAHMRETEATPLPQGSAFPLIKKMLGLNTPGRRRDRVEVVLISRNSQDAGLRVMHSLKHHGLDIDCALFGQGSDRVRYAEALGAHLFLSANKVDVEAAIKRGLAAATVAHQGAANSTGDGVLRFAFDGDSVLFSDEAERVYRTHGLDGFRDSEVSKAAVPMPPGPFKAFIQELSGLQKTFETDKLPLRIALVTARGGPAAERVLRTLRSWGVRLDEAIFADGKAKGPLLEAFGADIFFDDTMANIQSARLSNITSAHVPYGAGNGIVAASDFSLQGAERPGTEVPSTELRALKRGPRG